MSGTLGLLWGHKGWSWLCWAVGVMIRAGLWDAFGGCFQAADLPFCCGGILSPADGDAVYASTSREMIPGRVCSILLGTMLCCLPLGFLQNVLLVWLPPIPSCAMPCCAMPCHPTPPHPMGADQTL